MNLINLVEQAFANEKVASYPKFKAGDTITVTYRIKEGDKEVTVKNKSIYKIAIKRLWDYLREWY